MIFLKFTDEAQCLAALLPHMQDGTIPAYINDTIAIDVVGTIHRPTGETIDTDDGPVPQYAPIPGWHVNLSGDACPPDLEQYVMETPSSPVRVFLGE